MTCHRNLHNTSAVTGRTQFKRLGQNPLATQDAPLICAIGEQRRRRSLVSAVARVFCSAPQPRRLWRTGPGSVASCWGRKTKAPAKVAFRRG
jgi:hypothetical protein